MTSLETKRLILRPIELNDANHINFLCNDHAITSMTLLIPYPCALTDTITWINTQKLACVEGTQANFVITLKDSDTIIGVIGLDIDKQHENAKLGYWIGSKFWSNGYASEAAIAITQHAFAKLKLHRIYASAIKENIASIKVLQKIGMQYEGCLKEHVKKDGVFKDLYNYAILSGNYKLKTS